MVYFLGFVALISFSACMIFVGVYIERLAWNKLIQQGKIPKPSKPFRA